MRKIVVSILAAGLLITVFQNCGKAGFESEGQLADFASESPADAKVMAAPFPYEVSPNVISYMSCPTASTAPDKEAYYNFKVLAVDNTMINLNIAAYGASGIPKMADGGLKLKSDFVDYVNKNFKGTQAEATPAQILSVVQQHTEYNQARLQMSFRKQGEVRQGPDYWVAGVGPVADWILDKFSSTLINTKLSQNPAVFQSSFPKTTIQPGQIGKAFSMSSLDTTGEFTNAELRAKLYSSLYLTVNFVKNDAETSTNLQLASYPSGTDGIYGKGYAFIDFTRAPAHKYLTKPLTAAAAANPATTLLNVKEVDLETGLSTGASWHCMQYGIIRYQDRLLCPVESFIGAGFRRDELEVIRKVLRPEDWQVNTDRRCIVPTEKNKTFSCYATAGEPPPDEKTVWFNGARFGDAYANLTVPYGGGLANPGVEYRYWTEKCNEGKAGPSRECVNFVSFCYKRGQ